MQAALRSRGQLVEAVAPQAHVQLLAPARPVTIHATHGKAHTLGGYFHYTADGTLISKTWSVGIRIYMNGQKASAGDLGQVAHHDRSNSAG